MPKIFLVMAVAGALIPGLFFLQFFLNGGSASSFVSALFVNGAAGGFSADVLISSGVFWLFLAHQKATNIWAFVLINLSIGLSCALPLYLYFKYRDHASVST